MTPLRSARTQSIWRTGGIGVPGCLLDDPILTPASRSRCRLGPATTTGKVT